MTGTKLGPVDIYLLRDVHEDLALEILISPHHWNIFENLYGTSICKFPVYFEMAYKNFFCVNNLGCLTKLCLVLDGGDRFLYYCLQDLWEIL